MYVCSIYIAVWYRYGVQRSHVGLIRRVAAVYGAACGVCGRVAVWCGVAWQVIYGLRYARCACVRAVFWLLCGVCMTCIFRLCAICPYYTQYNAI